jgi:hypothetical protein
VPAAVTMAFVVAVVAGPLLPHSGGLPGAALGTTWLLYGLRTLAIFYGLLLLVIPLIRALRGELPVELSMRGARYAETGPTTAALDELRERVTRLDVQLRDLGGLTAEAFERIASVEGSRAERPRRPE